MIYLYDGNHTSHHNKIYRSYGEAGGGLTGKGHKELSDIECCLFEGGGYICI